MPSLETDTRMIMAILFVGAMAGVNVFAYSQYGITFPYGAEAHAVLFGISTVGGILIVKVMFDVFLSDVIEEALLRRAIDNYWGRKEREEQNKRRVRESMARFQQTYTPYGDSQLPSVAPIKAEEPETMTPAFLTLENQ
tara:strand:+ start:447 stop:863 length:417 start_codon:yes stop_codon:yes gene_type:complete